MNPLWLLLIIPAVFFAGAVCGGVVVLRHIRRERKQRLEEFLNKYHNAN